MELFAILVTIVAVIVLYRVLSSGDRPKKPKRRQITRIVDIDGRISFRGVPPEEWAALEEEYQRQEVERYRQ